MNTITQSELKEILQSAVDAVVIVPPALQPIAFAKAFDLIVSAGGKSRASIQNALISSPASKTRSSLNRPGPKAALEILISEKYFGSNRNEGEIRAFLKDSKGHEYSPNELSISLLRLIRKGMLAREKDTEGHYRYAVTKIK
jgi:hypothetical protein